MKGGTLSLGRPPNGLTNSSFVVADGSPRTSGPSAMSNKAKVAQATVLGLFLLVMASVSGVRAELAGGEPALPRTFLAAPESLLNNANMLRTANPPALLLSATDKLATAADLAAALTATEPHSVVKAHGSAKLPNGATANSYISFSPYYFPDPTKPDGIPYTKIDGCVSPRSTKPPSTRAEWIDFVRDLEVLSLAAYYANSNPGLFPKAATDYAAKAATLVKAWMVDPATRMDPNLQFAQLKNDGRDRAAFDWGVDVVSSPEVMDCLGILELFPTQFTSEIKAGAIKWVSDLRSWLEARVAELDPTRPIESASNNIRTIYEVFIAAITLYTSDATYDKAAAEAVCKRLQSTQIVSTGDQPYETARADPWLYSSSNMGQLIRLARLSDRTVKAATTSKYTNGSTEIGAGPCWTPELAKAAEYLLPPLLLNDIKCFPYPVRSGSRADLSLPADSMYLFWKLTGNETWLNAWANGEGTKVARWSDRARLWLPNSVQESTQGEAELRVQGGVFWPADIPKPTCNAKKSRRNFDDEYDDVTVTVETTITLEPAGNTNGNSGNGNTGNSAEDDSNDPTDAKGDSYFSLDRRGTSASQQAQRSQTCDQILQGMYKGTPYEQEFLGTGSGAAAGSRAALGTMALAVAAFWALAL